MSVLIVGSGFAGVGLAAKLTKKGIPYTILESSHAVGGTWEKNTYPGAACDVPSHLYSYSFHLNSKWSKYFSDQPEILQYIRDVANHYGVMDHVHLGRTVQSATWDKDSHTWHVTASTIDKDGNPTGTEEYEANFLVSAVGQLNLPNFPSIAKSDTFAGKSFHSARWDHTTEFEGKTVGVVGNGASAIQFVPEIAPKVDHLHVFQRTPSYVAPRPHYTYPKPLQWIFRHIPALMTIHRWWIFWTAREIYWLVIRDKKSKFNLMFQEQARNDMRKAIGNDEELASKILPHYTAGCKRILISNDYLGALTRPNVSLHTKRIAEMDASGVKLEDDQSIPLDVLIYSTGFRSTEFLGSLAKNIMGKDNVSLGDYWGDVPRAYLGMSVPSFPNFFMLYGPNTNLGHNSIIFMLECQFTYIVKSISALTEQGCASMNVRKDVMDAYQEDVEQTLDRTVFAAECNSWYRTKGKKIVNNCAWSCPYYWWRTMAPSMDDYRVSRARHKVAQ